MYIMSPENQALLEELVEQNYGGTPRGPAEIKALAKSDAPILSTTSGYFNTVFGAQVFQQLNISSTLFGLLPKFAYARGGFRTQKTRFLNAHLGQVQNAALPDTVMPDQEQVTVGIKEQAFTLEYSERMRLLASTKDDVGFDVASLLERAKQSFVYALDADLNAPNSAVIGGSSGYDVTQLDSLISSYSEKSSCSDVHSGSSDFYGIDRHSGATVYDSYVNHNSHVVRPLSDKIVRAVVQNTVDAGAEPTSQVWYTGEDTYTQIMALYQSQMRYVTPTDVPFKATTNINDGKPAGGSAMGMELGTLYGRPVYVAPTGKVASSGNISNLYLLDTGYDSLYNEPKIGIKVLQAPIIAETRLVTYPAHQKLGNKHVLYSAMELELKRPNIMGKARDLDVVS